MSYLEDAAADCLSELAGLDTYDINLCDHPKAWEAIEVFSTRVLTATWQPIATAPKDGKLILGWCVHEADPYFLDDGNRLTVYGQHSEAMGHVPDGPHVIERGGAFDDSTWEATGDSAPNWWFQFASDFEAAANPTHWMPLPSPPPRKP